MNRCRGSSGRPHAPAPRCAPGNGTRGFTLVEVLVVMAVTASLLVTFAGTQQYITTRAEALAQQSETLASGLAALAEMEQSIRLGEVIEASGTDLLTVQARYLVDRDDGWEKVRYSCDGAKLYREIAPDGINYGAKEVLQAAVTTFEAHTLEVTDHFSSATYGGVIPIPDAATVDLVGRKATYANLTELATKDADLAANVDLVQERLLLTPVAATGKCVTVSPALSRDGLVVETTFTPMDANADYHVLRYGAEGALGDGVAVVFENTGKVSLSVREGGVVTASDNLVCNWSAGTPHDVRLLFDHDHVTCSVDPGTGANVSGTLACGTIDNVPVHLLASTAGASGAWDDLRLAYPFVSLSITVDDGNGPRTLQGGASRRSP